MSSCTWAGGFVGICVCLANRIWEQCFKGRLQPIHGECIASTTKTIDHAPMKPLGGLLSQSECTPKVKQVAKVNQVAAAKALEWCQKKIHREGLHHMGVSKSRGPQNGSQYT